MGERSKGGGWGRTEEGFEKVMWHIVVFCVFCFFPCDFSLFGLTVHIAYC
jgi:hypothetical protein